MADIKTAYGTAVTGTGGITSLASSSVWTAGYEWFIVDNTTELALTWQLQGKVRVGTTPTVDTEVRIYLIPSYDGTTWPDVFDGTGSAETWTSAGVRDSVARWAATLIVDSTTSNRDYPYFIDVSQWFGGHMPKKVAVFVTHNTGVVLNATASEHTYAAQPLFETASG